MYSVEWRTFSAFSAFFCVVCSVKYKTHTILNGSVCIFVPCLVAYPNLCSTSFNILSYSTMFFALPVGLWLELILRFWNTARSFTVKLPNVLSVYDITLSRNAAARRRYCTYQWFSDIRFDSNNEAAWNLIISIYIPMENPDNYRTIVWKYLSYLYGLVSRCVIPTTWAVQELITLCSKLSTHVGNPQNV